MNQSKKLVFKVKSNCQEISSISNEKTMFMLQVNFKQLGISLINSVRTREGQCSIKAGFKRLELSYFSFSNLEFMLTKNAQNQIFQLKI